MSRLMLTFSGCLVAASLSALAQWMFVQLEAQRIRSQQSFAALLNREGDCEIVSLKFHRGDPDAEPLITVVDPATLTYLTNAIRTGSTQESGPGYSYNCTIGFSDGGSVLCGVSVPDNPKSLTILYPIDAFREGDYSTVKLPEPIPKELERAFRKLTR